MTTERHYDPTNDLLFKFVFGKGKRKHITLQFINDVMGLENDKAFVDLYFKNSELPPEKQGDKLGRLDVFAITNNGYKVDIEMQAIPHASMPQRTLFYWAHSYLQLDGLKSGKDYRGLHPTITINIMRHTCFQYNKDKAHSTYKILEIDTNHCLTKDLEIHFLEIPKFKNKQIRELSPLECRFAYYANRLNEPDKEALAMKNPTIGDAMEASKKFIMDDEEYFAYLARESAIWDYNTDRGAALDEGREEGLKIGLAEGHAKGHAEGRKEGLTEGRNEEREEVAKEMLRDNEPLEKIIKYSHLSESRIKELAEQIK